MKLALITTAALLVGACASPLKPNQTRVEFLTQPPGATISTGSQVWGVAPVQLDLPVNAGLSVPITATWVSGAKKTITLNLRAGQVASFTFNRPQGVAGLDSDIRWAMHLQQQKNDSSDALGAGMSNLGQALGNRGNNSNNNKLFGPSVNCTSRAVGDTVSTSCF